MKHNYYWITGLEPLQNRRYVCGAFVSYDKALKRIKGLNFHLAQVGIINTVSITEAKKQMKFNFETMLYKYGILED